MHTKHYSSPNVFASAEKFRKSGLLTKAVFLTCYCLLFVTMGCGSGTIGVPANSLQVSGNLDFGDVGLGQSAKKTIALANAGVTALSVSSANLSSSAFSLLSDQAFPITIPAGKTAPISIGFTPAATQDYTAQLTFIDSSAKPLGQIAARGRGQSSTQLTPQISANTNSVDFGDVDVDTTATQTISLTSTGTSAATIDAANVSGSGFVLTGGTLPATLKPGQSVDLTVQFNPTAEGSASGQLDVHSNASSGNTTVALRGSGTSGRRGKLTLSAGSLDFDSVTVNTATTQSLTLSSTGTSAVTINSANIFGSNFSIVGGVFPVTLNPGQSMTLRVQFKPTAAGSASGRLAIRSTASTGTTLLSLSGTATAAPSPQLTLSAGALSFGSVTVNTPTTQSLTLNSTGTAPVTIASATVVGSGFSLVDGDLPVRLNPGQSMVLQVQFNPSTTGAAAGRIVIRSNSSGSNGMAVTLSGSGTPAFTPQLKVSSSSLSFGDVTVNTAQTQSVTLNSTGTAPVTVTSGTIAGSGFSLVGGSFPATLAPGESMALKIRFNPSASGTATGQIVLSSNSSGSNALTIALAGNGTPAPAPLLTVASGRLIFGNVTVGTSTTQTLTLNSTGTSPVTVNALDVSGTGFVLTPSKLPAVLNPGQSMTLQVQFKPAATGTIRGQIAIDSDSSSGDATVYLRGTGTSPLDPELTVSSTSLSFGNVTTNTSVTRSLTLSSTGTASVTVNSATIAGGNFSLVSGGSFPITLTPGQSATLRIQFSPNAPGAAAGRLTINSNSSSGVETVSLSGNSTAAPVPQLTVSNTNLSFGSITVNTAKTQSLTLTSSGSAPLTVNSASIAGRGFSLTGGTLPTTLNPGQTLTLQIQYSPVATGASTGQLTISSNATPATTSVALSGSGTTASIPQLTVSNTSLAFGSVTVNTSSTQSLTLRSTGTAPVVINSTALTGSGFKVTGGALPATVNPGQSLTLQVSFTPTATGATTGQLTINSNSSPGAATVALSGTGAAAPVPQLTMSGSSLSFGSVAVNSSTTQVLTLLSTGTAPVTLTSAAITGAGFALATNPLPATLSPGQSLALQIRFSPTAAGAVAGRLAINSASGTATVALSGTGTAASVPQLTVSTASLAFGNVTVKTSAAQSLTLRSTGTASVTVNSASITGAGFSLAGGSLPATIAPGQSVTLQVQFNPTATGAVTGQVTINSNSSSGAARVALSGTGAAASTPQLTVSSSSLSFGSVAVNSSATQALTLRSTGTASVTVNSAAIAGGRFSIVAQSFPITLAAGQSVTLQIQFSPTTAGSATGQLTISSNSTGNTTTTVALSGTATATNPQLTVSASTLSFGSISLNLPILKTLTLTSTGTSTVTVSTVTISGTGFSLLGGSFPLSLAPGKSAILQLQFLPLLGGAQSGQATIVSNSTTGNQKVALSGTGAGGATEVDLSWDAPTSSPVSVVGYNIYRSIGTAGSFTAINSSPVAAVTFADKNITSGTTYIYIVKSVDGAGTESTPSNQITVAVP